MPPPTITRATVAWLVALTALAAVLRFKGLGAQSLWTDEAFTADLARMPFGRLSHAIAEDAHPPLFYLLERFAVSFGLDEWHLRLIPLVASIATLPMVFLLGRELLDARTGVIASAIYAITPCSVWYAQEARNSSLFTLEVVTATWLLVVALRSSRTRHLVGYALIVATAFYTHYFAALMVCAHVAIVVALRVARDVERTAVKRWVWALGGAVLLTAAWWPALATSRNLDELNWVPPARADDVVALFKFAWFAEFTPVDRAGAFAGVDGVVVIALLMVVETVIIWPSTSPTAGGMLGVPSRRHGIGLVVLACAIVVPIAAGFAISWLIRPIMVPRFYLAFLVPLYLAVAHGIARRSWIVGGAVMVLLAWRLWPATSWMITSTTKADLRAAVAELGAAAQPDDVVLVSPRWDRTYGYYARNRWALAVDASVIDDATLCRLAALHSGAWLLWSDRDPESVAVHARLSARWRETAVDAVPGEIHGGFHVSRFDTATPACPREAPPPGPRCTQRFELDHHAGARWVWVTGDFTGWAVNPALGAVALQRGADGIWSGTREVAPGPHEYKLVVDDTAWVIDPANPDGANAGVYRNSVFTCTP